MYRTFYKTNTGKIVICRRMNDENVAKRLQQYPDQSYINAYCGNVDHCKVDLDTLTLVDSPMTIDYTEWMRQRRNLKLIESDWTQGADSPLSEAKKAEWATYRQALRDIPANNSNPTDRDSIVWPSKPE
jgi:hypothetical protein